MRLILLDIHCCKRPTYDVINNFRGYDSGGRKVWSSAFFQHYFLKIIYLSHIWGINLAVAYIYEQLDIYLFLVRCTLCSLQGLQM